MTDLMNAFEALDIVPGWDPGLADIEELKGGLTNRTFHVRYGDDEFVLRLDSEQSGIFHLDRSCELSIMEHAGRAGLAPEVVFADADRGVLVTRYLDGRPWDDSDLESTQKLADLAELLRRVHALPLSGQRIDMSAVAASYENYLERRHGLHAFATRCVAIIAAIPVHENAACCHNDIVAPNIIEATRLMLIDWEFACDNDPLFDLASAVGFHNLDKSRSAVLLDAYAGGRDGELSERLAEQVRLYDAIQWLWLATRHLVHPSHWQAKRLEELQQRIG